MRRSSAARGRSRCGLAADGLRSARAAGSWDQGCCPYIPRPPASPVVSTQSVEDELDPVLLPQLLSVLSDDAGHVLDVA